jgi:recombination protein RecA
VVGSETRVKVVKNKVAPPFRQAEFDIIYGQRHLRAMGEIIDLGSEAQHHREVRRLVQLQGRAHRPGQGQRRQVSWRTTRDVAAALEKLIRDKLLTPRAGRESCSQPCVG